MSAREQITEFIRQKGPVLPVDIAKHIDSDIIIASAHLSELVSSKELKISHVKVGGSPLYYLSGQETKLQDFSNYLHEKEKKVYEKLKINKIMQDKLLEPLVRAALKNMTDFAVPLQVKYGNNTEIFWKWYLLTNQEVENLIKEKLKSEKPKQEPVQAKIPTNEVFPSQRELPKPTKDLTKPVKTTKADGFLQAVNNYFDQNKISKLMEKVIRKNSEAEFIIELPSTVGPLKYYCRAKTKKKINEGDLSSVFITAQSKKLPAIILTQGTLTKKAKEMLETEFKGMNVKNI